MKSQVSQASIIFQILLLLYEITAAPWSNINSNTLLTREDSSSSSQMQVPVWARKAGFHLKPKSEALDQPSTTSKTKSKSTPRITIQDQMSPSIASKSAEMNETEEGETGGESGESFSSLTDNLLATNKVEKASQNLNVGPAPPHSPSQITTISPSMLRIWERKELVAAENQKVGERNHVKDDEKPEEKDEEKDISKEDVDDEDDDEKEMEKENDNTYYGESDYEIEDEPECPENQFWHLRGTRCVPVSCPGGNHWRDTETGECILRQYRGSGKWRKKYSKKFGVPAHRTVSGLSVGRWVG